MFLAEDAQSKLFGNICNVPRPRTHQLYYLYLTCVVYGERASIYCALHYLWWFHPNVGQCTTAPLASVNLFVY